MSRHQAEAEPRVAIIGSTLAWLGGAHASKASNTPERGAYEVAGLVVVLGGLLAWLVATVAVASSTTLPTAVVALFTLPIGLLVAALQRALASGRQTKFAGLLGRGLLALFIGLVLGELASIGIFNGAIDRELDQQSAQRAPTAPAVVAANQTLEQLRGDKSGLENAVRTARDQANAAETRANCEYNPTPGCPPGITGDPGVGPQTRTARELSEDAKRELEQAKANLADQVTAIDDKIAAAETAKDEAAVVDRGLGARWTAMHDYSVANFGALLLRLLSIAFFAVLMLLPLLLKLWRGETTVDHRAAAHAARERAELDAETAIALKRAEVRAEAERVWAEQKLTSARFAAEAETAIEREQQRRRVAAAYEEPAPIGYTPRQQLPTALDMPMAALPAAAKAHEAEIEAEPEQQYLPVAFDAPLDYVPGRESQNLPAVVPPARVEPRKPEQPKAPSIGLPKLNPLPDLARAVTGAVKPFVPPVVTRLTSTNPLKSARSVFEEFEEIRFSFSRKRTVTVDEQVAEPQVTTTTTQVEQLTPPEPAATALPHYASTRVFASATAADPLGLDYNPWATDSLGAAAPQDLSRGLTEREGHPELAERKGPRELDERQGPRELPSA